MLRLRTCTPADAPLLIQALNECLYRGYRFRVVMTEDRFAEDARIHDVDLSASFLALNDAQPVGVTLVGRRGDRAWIGGMGVHPTLRGKGLGTKLLARSQDRLRAQGVRVIELEVLVENSVARRCYAHAGFVARRRYYCFRGNVSRIPWGGRASRIIKAQPEKIIEMYDSMHSTSACWQRELTTLEHRKRSLNGLIAIRKNETIATLLHSESAVTDVGWLRDGPKLDRPLHELLVAAFGPSRPFAIVNVPNDDPLCNVMHNSGFEVYAEQLDMRCEL